MCHGEKRKKAGHKKKKIRARVRSPAAPIILEKNTEMSFDAKFLHCHR